MVGHKATGIDVNPLAVLLARAKCVVLDPERLLALGATIVSRSRRPRAEPTQAPDLPNISLWFSPNAIACLGRLRGEIEPFRSSVYWPALALAFSLAVRAVSYADPSVPVPVRVRSEKARSEALAKRFRGVEKRAKLGDAIGEFAAAIARIARRYGRLLQLVPTRRLQAKVYQHDARNGLPATVRARGPFDLAITSPPYCAAQKYVRSTSLSLAWLNLAEGPALAGLEQQTIGREHVHRAKIPHEAFPALLAPVLEEIEERNPTRHAIAVTYASEMRKALRHTVDALAKDGKLLMVVSDNQVAGVHFPIAALLTEFLEESGMVLDQALRDRIHSRGLLLRRRADAGVITHEFVLTFRRAS